MKLQVGFSAGTHKDLGCWSWGKEMMVRTGDHRRHGEDVHVHAVGRSPPCPVERCP
jgi:hypothetical protein